MKFSDPAYGEFSLEERVLLEALRSGPVQRLKGISQYGTWQFIMPSVKSSRFDHSLGVCFLLRKLGASLEEQLAGLVHDISHTAFSHVIDYIYGKQDNQEHHEELFQHTLMSSEIPKIAENGGIKANLLMNAEMFPLLEKSIPNLCADRLDYFFRDSVLIGVCRPEDIRMFMQHLIVKGGEILVDDPIVARKMALGFIECMKKFWGSPTQAASYQILADAIKSALEAKIISEKDFMLTDQGLYSKMKSSGKLDVTSKLDILRPGFFAVNSPQDYDFFAKTKVRYIDPTVIQNGEAKRLSRMDDEYEKEMVKFISSVSQGYYVKIFQG